MRLCGKMSRNGVSVACTACLAFEDDDATFFRNFWNRLQRTQCQYEKTWILSQILRGGSRVKGPIQLLSYPLQLSLIASVMNTAQPRGPHVTQNTIFQYRHKSITATLTSKISYIMWKNFKSDGTYSNRLTWNGEIKLPIRTTGCDKVYIWISLEQMWIKFEIPITQARQCTAIKTIRHLPS